MKNTAKRNLQKVSPTKSHFQELPDKKLENILTYIANHPDWLAKEIRIDKDFKDRSHWRVEFGKRAFASNLIKESVLASSSSRAVKILKSLKTLDPLIPVTPFLPFMAVAKGAAIGVVEMILLYRFVSQGLASISVLRRENGDALRPQEDIYGELMRLARRPINLEPEEPLSIEAIDKKDHYITVQINLDRKRGDIKRDIDVLLKLLDIEARMLNIKLPTPKRPRFDNFQDMITVYDLRNKENLSWSEIAQRIFPTEVHPSTAHVRKARKDTIATQNAINKVTHYYKQVEKMIKNLDFLKI
jgi:hypothetical protein